MGGMGWLLWLRRKLVQQAQWLKPEFSSPDTGEGRVGEASENSIQLCCGFPRPNPPPTGGGVTLTGLR